MKGFSTLKNGTTKKKASFFTDRSKSFTESDDGKESDEFKILGHDDLKLAAEAKLWTSAIDHRTGRTYWYNEKTHATQWRKPLCLSTTLEERNNVAVEEQHQRDFFAAMEANILSSMSAMIPLSLSDDSMNSRGGKRIDSSEKDDNDDNKSDDSDDIPERRLTFTRTISGSKGQSLDSGGRRQSRQASIGIDEFSTRGRVGWKESESSLQSSATSIASRQQMLVRTISNMDDVALQTFVCRQPSVRSILKKPNTASGWRKTAIMVNGDKQNEKEDVKSTNQNRVRFGGIHIHFEKEQMPQESLRAMPVNNKNSSEDFTESQSENTDKECAPAQQLGREESIMLTSLLPPAQSNNISTNNNNNSMSLRSMLPSFRRTSANDMSMSLSGFGGASVGGNIAQNNQSGSLGSLTDGLMPTGDGDMMFEQSNIDFDLSNEELAAFTKLSEITNEMTSWDNELDDSEYYSRNDEDYEYYAYPSEHDESTFNTTENLDGKNEENDQIEAIDAITVATPQQSESLIVDDKFASDQLNVLNELEEASQSSSSSETLEDRKLAVEEAAYTLSKALLDQGKEQTMPNESKRPSMAPKVRRHRSSIQLTTPATSNRRLIRPVKHSQPDVAMPLPSSSVATRSIIRSRGTSVKALVRNNTCASLYATANTASSGLSAPDTDATIKCVCGIYRAQMVQTDRIDKELSVLNTAGNNSDDGLVAADILLEYNLRYSVFNDVIKPPSTSKSKTKAIFSKLSSSFSGNERTFSASFSKFEGSEEMVVNNIPSLDEIARFYRDVFQHTKVDSNCVIVSLIYIERLIHQTMGVVRPRICNWRTILFTCVMLASRVWDDVESSWNGEFTHYITTTDGGSIDDSSHHKDLPGKGMKNKYSSIHFSPDRLDQLDRAIITALDNQVKVLASEYAKYYFVLRSMLIKSGMGSDDLTQISPLDIDGARRLQHLSTLYEKKATAITTKRTKAT